MKKGKVFKTLWWAIFIHKNKMVCKNNFALKLLKATPESIICIRHFYQNPKGDPLKFFFDKKMDFHFQGLTKSEKIHWFQRCITLWSNVWENGPKNSKYVIFWQNYPVCPKITYFDFLTRFLKHLIQGLYIAESSEFFLIFWDLKK